LSLQEIDEGAQRSRHVAATVVVEERSGERRQPVGKHALKRAVCKLRGEELLEGGDEAETLDSHGDLDLDRIADHRTLRHDADNLSVLFEFQWMRDAAGEAMTDHGVVEHFRGMFRPAVLRKIRGRAGKHETLPSGPER